MVARLLIVTGCLTATGLYLPRVSRTGPVPIRESLAGFPMAIDGWRGVAAPAWEEKVVDVLGVDEYLNRVYVAPDRGPVGLYIGYYGSQREGGTIHSPMNCLPGAGWEPVDTARIAIPIEAGGPRPEGTRNGARAINVNRFVIQKGVDKQVVIYWYQSHGRAIASEYWGKIYLVLDAIRMNRTDGALVRVLSPISGASEGGEAAAEQRAVEFVRAVFPVLRRYLPD